MKKRLGFDLILLGDSTAGKDTQASILEKKFNIITIRSGEYLRSIMNKSRYRNALSRTYKKGHPAPSWIINELLVSSINKAKIEDLVFVGAARLLSEAKFLKQQLDFRQRDFYVIYLKLPKKIAIERYKTRSREALDSDKFFIENRFKYYREQVSKTVEYFKKLKRIKFINASLPINIVHKEIIKIINDHKKRGANK